MDDLRKYVDEVCRQSYRLSRACALDDATLCPGAYHSNNGKKHRTRQDANRLEYESAIEESYEQSKDLPALQQIALQDAVPRPRMRTRLAWFLTKYYGDINTLARTPIRPFHDRALAEAQRLGVYATLSPLIVAATGAHKALLDSYAGFADGDGALIYERHEEAVAALKMHLPNSREPGDAKTETQENNLEQFLEIASESAAKIFHIASSSGISCNDKMRQICEMDASYWARLSPAWARLLRVTEAAIKKTTFWKVDRPKQIQDTKDRWMEGHPDRELPSELRTLK